MVSTRIKNKDARPGAPVMTEAAKIKAGIPSAKRQSKKPSKAEQIRILEARIAAFENPDDDDTMPISQEPLFTRDSSPEDVDRLVTGSEAPTELDSEEYTIVGGKRIPSSSYDPRALKRTKAYTSFNDIRPTIRNKPSGLVGNWSQVLTKAGSPLHRSPSSTLSTPSSSSQVLSPSVSTSWEQDTFPMMSNTGPVIPVWDAATPFTNTGPAIPAWDAATPFIGQTPFPFQFNMQQYPQATSTPQTVGPFPPAQIYSLPRRHKDGKGKLQIPGQGALPHGIKIEFRNTFIRHIMRLVCSDTTPWTNPLLPFYQQEFAAIYPGLPYQIHANDAVTNRDLGVLRNHIGAEGFDEVVKSLAVQFSKRTLNSKAAKAAYINTLLNSSQRPFIWEYFRPGTIEIPRGEETYYDEKRRGRFQSIPVLRAFLKYYTFHGIRARLPSEDAGRPIGALALAAAAVERGYYLHRFGELSSTTNKFSSTNWINATNRYLGMIAKLTDGDWDEIFVALYQVQESHTHEAQVEAGVDIEEEEYESLLPDDPPTPPPS
ncbi:hypothetical protein BJ322DRAFT_1109639 [Thelephora terrestris]|uniref:Uncharacterized protein n=1 Tax=Thelephora terrestris TaxID=56493 RepID=A0A9P6L559_9AGAM|nr:hypothetical protein BJ322DRAFT_1109639 [Thelephora terrestris]